MNLKAWAPKGLETLGAIQVTATQTLNRDNYLAILADRLQSLAEANPEDVAQASEILVDAGLLQAPLEEGNPQNKVGNQILWDNEEMTLHLHKMGVPGILPPKVVISNKVAQEALDQTSLLMWATEAVDSLIHRE